MNGAVYFRFLLDASVYFADHPQNRQYRWITRDQAAKALRRNLWPARNIYRIVDDLSTDDTFNWIRDNENKYPFLFQFRKKLSFNQLEAARGFNLGLYDSKPNATAEEMLGLSALPEAETHPGTEEYTPQLDQALKQWFQQDEKSTHLTDERIPVTPQPTAQTTPASPTSSSGTQSQTSTQSATQAATRPSGGPEQRRTSAISTTRAAPAHPLPPRPTAVGPSVQRQVGDRVSQVAQSSTVKNVGSLGSRYFSKVITFVQTFTINFIQDILPPAMGGGESQVPSDGSRGGGIARQAGGQVVKNAGTGAAKRGVMAATRLGTKALPGVGEVVIAAETVGFFKKHAKWIIGIPVGLFVFFFLYLQVSQSQSLLVLQLD